MSDHFLTSRIKELIFCLYKFIRNYEILFYSFFIIFLSIIQTVVITNNFVQEDYGFYAFFISLSQVIFIFSNWGYTSWGINEISLKGRSYLTLILNKIIVSKFVIGGISLILLLVYVRIESGENDFIVISAFLLYFLSIVFSLDILYIAIGEVDKMVRILLVSKLLYTILFIGLLSFFNLSYTLLFMLFALQALINSVFLYFSQNNFKFKFYSLSSISIGSILESWPYFVIVLFSFLFASGPVILAGHLLSKESFSVVYASTAIVKLVQASYQPLINKILPKLNLGLAVETDIILALIFSILATLTLYLFAPFIVEIIFNNNYEGLLPAIRLFSLSIVPGIMSTIIIGQWAVHTNNLRLMYASIALVLGVNIIIFILFAESLSWQFVIWSMLLSEICLFCLVFFLRKWKI